MGNTCLNIKINERIKNLNQNIILNKRKLTIDVKLRKNQTDKQLYITYKTLGYVHLNKHIYIFKKYGFYLLLISFYKNLEEKNLK